MPDTTIQKSSTWSPGFVPSNAFNPVATPSYDGWIDSIVKAMIDNIGAGAGGYPPTWDQAKYGNWDRFIGATTTNANGQTISMVDGFTASKIAQWVMDAGATDSWVLQNWGPPPARSASDYIETPTARAARIGQENWQAGYDLNVRQQDFTEAKFYIGLAMENAARSSQASGGGGGGGSADAIMQARLELEAELGRGQLDLARLTQAADEAFRRAQLAEQQRQFDVSLAEQQKQRQQQAALQLYGMQNERGKTMAQVIANPGDAVQADLFKRGQADPLGNKFDIFTGQQLPGQQATFTQVAQENADTYKNFTQGKDQLGNPLPGFAVGTEDGFTREDRFVAGDSLDGLPNEELIYNPTKAPIAVIPKGQYDPETGLPHFALGTWDDPMPDPPGYIPGQKVYGDNTIYVSDVKAETQRRLDQQFLDQNPQFKPTPSAGMTNPNAFYDPRPAGSLGPPPGTYQPKGFTDDYGTWEYYWDDGAREWRLMDTKTGRKMTNVPGIAPGAAQSPDTSSLPLGGPTPPPLVTAKAGEFRAGSFDKLAVGVWELITNNAGITYMVMKDASGKVHLRLPRDPSGGDPNNGVDLDLFDPNNNGGNPNLTHKVTVGGVAGGAGSTGVTPPDSQIPTAKTGIETGEANPHGYSPVKAGGAYEHNGFKYNLTDDMYIGPNGVPYYYNTVMKAWQPVQGVPTVVSGWDAPDPNIKGSVAFTSLPPEVQQAIRNGASTGYFLKGAETWGMRLAGLNPDVDNSTRMDNPWSFQSILPPETPPHAGFNWRPDVGEANPVPEDFGVTNQLPPGTLPAATSDYPAAITFQARRRRRGEGDEEDGTLPGPGTDTGDGGGDTSGGGNTGGGNTGGGNTGGTGEFDDFMTAIMDFLRGPSGMATLQYEGSVWQNAPSLLFISGQMSPEEWGTIGSRTTYIPALDVTLPAPNSMSYTKLQMLKQSDPFSFDLMKSLWRAGNRDLESEMSLAYSYTPTGFAVETSAVRT